MRFLMNSSNHHHLLRYHVFETTLSCAGLDRGSGLGSTRGMLTYHLILIWLKHIPLRWHQGCNMGRARLGLHLLLHMIEIQIRPCMALGFACSMLKLSCDLDLSSNTLYRIFLFRFIWASCVRIMRVITRIAWLKKKI